MKPRPPLPPPPYLVLGLARSGVAAALALREADASARVVACDRDRPPEAEAARERLSRAGVEIHLETDGLELLAASQPRTLIKSPGVPAEAAVVRAARERGITVIGELELGWRLVPNEFCAVTGTNGKTTVTELIGEIYRHAGLPVAVAGNVGVAVSSYAGSTTLERDGGATIVCEASSFQLEDTVEFAPEVGVFLNLSEDHLDRHGTLDRYLEAKLQAFARQRRDDVAVLNAGESVLRDRELGGEARRVWFGSESDCDLRLERGRLLWEGRPVIDASEIRLRGPHNIENAMAAAAAVLVRGIDGAAIRSALREFTGVAHRLEEVASVNGVLYVNDSKATNAASAVASLRAFGQGVHAILGGSSKGASFEALTAPVADHCRVCYLIGEASERIAADLAQSGVQLVRSGDLERALREASRRARPGETVLLAPAAASFDQYRDFEARGEHFRSLVRRLNRGPRQSSSEGLR